MAGDPSMAGGRIAPALENALACFVVSSVIVRAPQCREPPIFVNSPLLYSPTARFNGVSKMPAALAPGAGWLGVPRAEVNSLEIRQFDKRGVLGEGV